MANIEKQKRKRQSNKDDCPILTMRQVQILRLIQNYRDNNGCSPTLQEMAAELNLSKVTVFEHVEALVKKGVLHRLANKARSLTLDRAVVLSGIALPKVKEGAGEQGGSASFEGAGCYPMSGYIAAGMPLEAVETPDTLDLASMFESGAGTFALKVRGDSMIDEHICDGDFVLVEKSSQGRDGEIVVAILEDGQATLKKIYRDGKGYRLEGANPEFKTIYADQVEVRGVVLGVLRRF